MIRITKEQQKEIERVLSICNSETGVDVGVACCAEDLGCGWQKLHDEVVHRAWYVQGMDGEVVAFLEYDQFVEVGVGVALRPYTRWYQGTDVDGAIEDFTVASFAVLPRIRHYVEDYKSDLGWMMKDQYFTKEVRDAELAVLDRSLASLNQVRELLANATFEDVQ